MYFYFTTSANTFPCFQINWMVSDLDLMFFFSCIWFTIIVNMPPSVLQLTRQTVWQCLVFSFRYVILYLFQLTLLHSPVAKGVREWNINLERFVLI